MTELNIIKRHLNNTLAQAGSQQSGNLRPGDHNEHP